jgi:nucleoside-diphosphate-sugar epimerase
MRILFTGASSFTGYWFVKALAAAGHEIVCPLTKDLEHYTGPRRQRLDLLKPVCRLVPRMSFGSESFLGLAAEEHFDQLCHHAAEVTNYKSPDFDVAAAVQNNTHNLVVALDRLHASGLGSVVLTGTYFEAGEGAGSEPLRTFSPYSRSKTLTFEAFQTQCRTRGLTLGKFVLPNPFGPLEEPRFTAFLMKNWRGGKPVVVQTPEYIRDNIHVDLLALAYAAFAALTTSSNASFLKINPSGYVEKQGEFAQRVARETKGRLGWACELTLARQEDFSEPLNRHNPEPALTLAQAWNEAKAWDGFAEYYAK